jgi:2-phospho-L-lactate guanylyltransferase
VNTISRDLPPPLNEKPPATFVIVPVKRLSEAKSRLSPLLSETERRQFCLAMLKDVLTAVSNTEDIHRTVVVSKDPHVLQAAKKCCTLSLEESRSGLNQAISEAINWCITMTAKGTLILPADIPLISSQDLDKILLFGRESSMVICPSRTGDGTNALFLNPPRAVMTFYGRRSFHRYVKEASKRRIPYYVHRSPRIALDIDTVKDISDFVAMKAEKTHAYNFLMKLGIRKRLSSISSSSN